MHAACSTSRRIYRARLPEPKVSQAPESEIPDIAALSVTRLQEYTLHPQRVFDTKQACAWLASIHTWSVMNIMADCSNEPVQTDSTRPTSITLEAAAEQARMYCSPHTRLGGTPEPSIMYFIDRIY